ncbi:MAG: AI-2E family transporter [Chlorobi bacterium CHB2]|nr:AI-2E family transporter [Chlorobi bacterium CHB2]
MEHTQDEAPQPTSPTHESDTGQPAPTAGHGSRNTRRPHIALRRSIRPQEMFALVGGFALYGLLLFTVSSNYGLVVDFFVVAALVFLLYPFRREIVSRRVMQLGVGTFLLWLCTTLAGVLFPFIAAFIIAYILSPLVLRFQRRGIPRWATSVAIVLMILGTYVLIGFYVIPPVIDEINNLWTSAQAMLRDANRFLDKDKLTEQLTRLGIPKKQAQEIVVSQILPQLKGVGLWLASTLFEVVKNLTTVLEGVFNLIAIPVLALYMMLDFERLRGFVRRVLLRDNKRYVHLVRRTDHIISSYLRGILTTSSIVAVLATTTLVLFDVPYAVVIGILTGVCNFIPTIGMFMNLGIAMVFYLFAPGDFWIHTLITTGMIGGLHALNAYLIEPNIIGESVGLHPVVMIASLFVFAHFFGFLGLVVAVPITAVVVMLLREWYQRSMIPQQQG